MAVREAENHVDDARTTQSTPRESVPALRQPTFDWKVSDKYHELSNFGIKVINFLNNYDIQESKKVLIITR